MKKNIYALLITLSLFCILPAIPAYNVTVQNIMVTSKTPPASDTEDSNALNGQNMYDDAEPKAETYSFPKNDDIQLRY